MVYFSPVPFSAACSALSTPRGSKGSVTLTARSSTGGGGCVLPMCLRHAHDAADSAPGRLHLDVVELSPDVAGAARDHFGARDSEGGDCVAAAVRS